MACAEAVLYLANAPWLQQLGCRIQRGCWISCRVPQECSEAVKGLISACMEAEPADRPSARDVVDMLSQAGEQPLANGGRRNRKQEVGHPLRQCVTVSCPSRDVDSSIGGHGPPVERPRAAAAASGRRHSQSLSSSSHPAVCAGRNSFHEALDPLNPFERVTRRYHTITMVSTL